MGLEDIITSWLKDLPRSSDPNIFKDALVNIFEHQDGTLITIDHMYIDETRSYHYGFTYKTSKGKILSALIEWNFSLEKYEALWCELKKEMI